MEGLNKVKANTIYNNTKILFYVKCSPLLKYGKISDLSDFTDK